MTTDSKNCIICNSSFTRPKRESAKSERWQNRKFCSHKCSGLGAPRTKARDEAERFWEKVDKTGECWLWTASLTVAGYGSFMSASGKCEVAHRVSYRLTYGPPGALRVCHSCDTPACVRPDHLFLGTAADNTADMMAKGRGTIGVKSAAAKLTDAQVLAIRADTRTQHALAAEYGVHICTIASIRQRKTWRHI